MKKTLAIAKWEYLEKVKTKAFIISLIVTPAIIILFSIIPSLLASKEDDSSKLIGFLDKSEIYFHDFQIEIENYKLENEQPNYILVNLNKDDKSEEQLKTESDEDVFEGLYDAFLYVKNGGTDSMVVELRSKAIANFRDIARFSEAFDNVRISHKIEKEAIDPDLVAFLKSSIRIDQIKIEEGGKEGTSNFETVFFSSFIFILLLMMMVIYSGQMLVRSLLEEKSNRIIEILVSSCNPNQLACRKSYRIKCFRSYTNFNMDDDWSCISRFCCYSIRCIQKYFPYACLLCSWIYFFHNFICRNWFHSFHRTRSAADNQLLEHNSGNSHSSRFSGNAKS